MAAMHGKSPLIVRIFAVILILLGGFAGLGSLLLWGQGFLFNFPENIKLATPIADFLINFPVSVMAGVGLWRMRKFGYVAAQFVAGIYIYASVTIFVDMFQGHLPLSPEIWAPQAFAVVIGFLLVFVLWPLREQFE
ncbi:hypothetical protein KQH62_01070 [bacterium]|nr:hypothetical protein [bacterium]